MPPLLRDASDAGLEHLSDSSLDNVLPGFFPKLPDGTAADEWLPHRGPPLGRERHSCVSRACKRVAVRRCCLEKSSSPALVQVEEVKRSLSGGWCIHAGVVGSRNGEKGLGERSLAIWPPIRLRHPPRASSLPVPYHLAAAASGGTTTNGDGLNDFLKPVPVGLKEFHYFNVFNRFGQLLFSTTNASTGWDGKIQGKEQNSGTYVWIAEAIDYKGNIIQQKGYSTLIR